MTKSTETLKKEIAALQSELEERLTTKNIVCECGRSKHYEDANFCVNCGKKLG